MDKKSRRGLLANGAKAAAIAAGGALLVKEAAAQPAKLEKRSPYPAPSPKPDRPPMYSRAVAYGTAVRKVAGSAA